MVGVTVVGVTTPVGVVEEVGVPVVVAGVVVVAFGDTNVLGDRVAGVRGVG